jgi:hypothetical protein
MLLKRRRMSVQLMRVVVLRAMRASQRFPRGGTEWIGQWHLRRVLSYKIPAYWYFADVARRVFVRLDDARGGAAVGTPRPRVGSGREAIG